jgi:hypothetical protein
MGEMEMVSWSWATFLVLEWAAVVEVYCCLGLLRFFSLSTVEYSFEFFEAQRYVLCKKNKTKKSTTLC